ncbi:MAG: phosphate ABC transporter substrate-binding protein [Leptospiraceae bacterium]|nr:phosphate ABC transporter substrate-binding protein [Leptospiraceae bacterium]MCP5493617.1 phosphate ABC transporter substrate-binding protein [Leptospiraceae bacterium]
MKSLTYIVFILISMFFQNCQKSLLVTGSETMHPMMLILANAYMKTNSRTTVDIKGGGSKVGIDSLIKKQTDIAVASRDILPEESEKLDKNGKLEKLTIAYDGASIVVHPQNPIESITLTQASDIFSGKITNWKEIGGSDSRIQVIIRNDNSGTAYFFKEHILQKHDLGEDEYNQNKNLEYTSTSKTVQDNSELLEIVSKNPDTIAYIGMGSAISEISKKVKPLKYHRTDETEAIIPSIENVYNRKYKLARPLFILYYQGTGKVDEFISFITSEQGQQAVIKSGYLRSSLPEVKISDKKQ